MAEITLAIAIVIGAAFVAMVAAVGIVVFAFSRADVVVRMPEFSLNQRD